MNNIQISLPTLFLCEQILKKVSHIVIYYQRCSQGGGVGYGGGAPPPPQHFEKKIKGGWQKGHEREGGS